jgi:hypothetical protein
MNNDLTFGITTNLFVVAWVCLAVAVFLPGNGRWRPRLLNLGGRILPIFLLFVYLAGFLMSRGSGGNLFTFAGVVEIFSVPEKVLIIWIEILAYALFVGRWVIDHATEARVPRILVFACLLILFYSGGLGLLAYILVITAIKAAKALGHRFAARSAD